MATRPYAPHVVQKAESALVKHLYPRIHVLHSCVWTFANRKDGVADWACRFRLVQLVVWRVATGLHEVHLLSSRPAAGFEKSDKIWLVHG